MFITVVEIHMNRAKAKIYKDNVHKIFSYNITSKQRAQIGELNV